LFVDRCSLQKAIYDERRTTSDEQIVMDAIAKGKFLRGSPQKARLVIDLIRGKNVSNALAILQFTNKRATHNIEKCLRSAIANATFKAEQQNVAIDPDDLWVKSCFVDMGPHKNRRRVRPAPQGRAFREQRYYCHITIELTSDKPADVVAKEEKAKAAKANAKTRAAKKAEPAAKTPAAPVVTEAPEEVVNAAPVEETVEATPVETAATVTEAPVETETTTTTDGETAAATEETAATDNEEK
jgi:large subunit ribosomal protein L22